MKMILFVVFFLPFVCLAEFSDFHDKEVQHIVSRWIEPSLKNVPIHYGKNVELLIQYIRGQKDDSQALLKLIKRIQNSDHRFLLELSSEEQYWLSPSVLERLAYEQYFKLINFNRVALGEVLESDPRVDERNMKDYLFSTQKPKRADMASLRQLVNTSDYDGLRPFAKMVAAQLLENPGSEESAFLTNRLFFNDKEVRNHFLYDVVFNLRKGLFCGYKESRLCRVVFDEYARTVSLEANPLGIYLDIFDQKSLNAKRDYLQSELRRLDELEELILKDHSMKKMKSERGAVKKGTPNSSLN